MDATAQYSMRWDDFSSHFTSEFESLRNDEQFVDVTLCCDDRFIKAHKVILSACSPYFKKILMVTFAFDFWSFENLWWSISRSPLANRNWRVQMNPSKHVTVIMHNVEYELMKTLVDFMYLGEVLVNQNNVDRLFKLAKTFNVQGFQNGFIKNEVGIIFVGWRSSGILNKQNRHNNFVSVVVNLKLLWTFLTTSIRRFFFYVGVGLNVITNCVKVCF